MLMHFKRVLLFFEELVVVISFAHSVAALLNFFS